MPAKRESRGRDKRGEHVEHHRPRNQSPKLRCAATRGEIYFRLKTRDYRERRVRFVRRVFRRGSRSRGKGVEVNEVVVGVLEMSEILSTDFERARIDDDQRLFDLSRVRDHIRGA